MSDLTDFERRVLDACLAGDDPKLAVLRLQAEVASVAGREHTGTGAYITLAVPPTAPVLEPGAIVIGDVDLKIAGVPEGVATLLYAYEGTLRFIEIAAYEGEWPEDPEILGIGYLQEIPIAGDAYSLVPVDTRHAETVARSLSVRGAPDDTQSAIPPVDPGAAG
ncbi:hypothetical protein [Montanilutibacter psychrotolerans]|uniref:Uncharacterized protein n=1 Tax=Montanilutibacter psychrotolerans TaxID=1327343 RepID=A0A3M8STY9_9GAMM|nr:hypothetical protein [Lysobacter psychrotolerans]RNF84165.1 hypothetical protein EER27_07100 [Lysobacter psychrotolerans]